MVKTKKSMWFISFVLLLSLLLAACGGANQGTEPTPEQDGADTGDVTEEAVGGDLIIAWLSDAVSLDPHSSNDIPSSNVAYNIYEGLVVLDENSELQPRLATEWTQVDDTTWEFKLREGVKFHDGSDFTAEVVKANIDRILDPEVASQRAFLFAMINEVVVVDDYTVQFKTEYPFAPLPAHLAHNGGGMISLESIKADYEKMAAGENVGTAIAQTPVGTGFFKFDSWTPGEQVKLVRNEEYWGEKAKLDSVTFKVVNESLTRISELETGYAHIADPVQPSDINRVDNFADASVNRQTSTSLSYIGFNAQKAPFDNVKVRQAISMALNKDDIINGIYEGTGIPAVGPVAPGVFGHDESVTPIPYDVDKAKELLAEAGHPNGFSTTIWTNDNPQRIQIAEYAQSKLSEIGIDVKVEVLEWGAYLENTANGNHDMFILGWSTPTADADYAMYALFHSSNFGAAGNRTFLKDAELDELLDKGRQEADQDARKQYYRQAQEKLVELAPMLYIHHQEYLNGVRSEVKGFRVNSGGIFQLQNVSLTK
ncbi:glutathione ABC transporter substrate-binding protein [Caldalkalibacillus mannanilyticus]|uniref:glutathione ABC transporter substrate-binding protein n=1 Tax=Caldalkalibacillus mannanilyticus TaxID=1418 RepID=UPI0004684E1E|nr:glutathione ABC transporter substrate-binding protein [Caldalkalibacillus mannanilyticus]